jgi:hypothetical protein
MHRTLAVASARPLHQLAAVALLALSLAVAPAHAQIWTESPDAGDLVPTAQVTAGVGALTQIQGFLAAPTDVDVYCVRLATPPPALAALIGLNCAVIQGPNVWLFDAAGNGIGSNNTCSGGSKQIITPNTGLSAGNYYVAVSYYDYDPQSVSGAIWQPGPPFWRAPDGPGAAGTLTGWAGNPNVQPLNPYQVFLNPGFTFCESATVTSSRTWGTLKIRYR